MSSNAGELLTGTAANDVKSASARGGAITMVAQVGKLVLRVGSMMALARLLSPEDFGLQGMVLALTSFVGLFRDAGLSMATVQRHEIQPSEASTLFWINVSVGLILTLLVAAAAPALATFYKEPRLLPVTVAMSSIFMIGALSAQHQAILQRNMRFSTLARIDISSLAISSGVGITTAAMGWSYWSLVAMAVSAALVSAAGPWLSVNWRPGKPARIREVHEMLRFGWTVTLNALVVYVAYNAEKVLLGRYWGPQALGLYGRAYQLANLPTEQLNSSVSSVAFSALSRLQADKARIIRVFLKIYGVNLSVTIPITLAFALFAEEIIYVVLGAKWLEAATLLRLLSPTIIVFAMLNPFGWFLQATGRVSRSLRMAFLIAPVVLLAIWIGLPYGPAGVAAAYSSAMMLLAAPLIVWAAFGTGITPAGYWQTTRPPLVSGAVASLVGMALKWSLVTQLTPIWSLVIALTTVLGIYTALLLLAFRQGAVYADLLNQAFGIKVPSTALRIMGAVEQQV